MNDHFERGFDAAIVLPLALFAQIERIEPGASIRDPHLVTFDAIDREWIRKQGQTDSCFRLHDLVAMEQAWRNYWTRARSGAKPANPFAAARLFRVEIEMTGEDFAGLGGALALAEPMDVLESKWFEISSVDGDGLDASVYPGAFAGPRRAKVSVAQVTDQEHRALSQLVTLDDFDEVNTEQLKDELKDIQAELLAVYDVGQGNANGLLMPSRCSGRQSTALYYDLGCGVYGNRSTTPSPLYFCFKHAPLVLLSHWDSDHWMGACIADAKNQKPALGLDWIAPRQQVTTHHKTFALDVLAAGGTFRIYNPPPGTVGVAAAPGGNDRIRFTVGTGSGRNHSGIVLAVEKFVGTAWRSWLLTGDCDYGHFLAMLAPAPVVGLVVPHHGAAPHTGHPPPPPIAGYCRIAYSFGSGNLHGSVRHPTAPSVTQHDTAGWLLPGWVGIASPGNALPVGNALATCTHSAPAFRAGALIGWTSVPTTLTPPCVGGCSTLPTQS